jgi:phosphatidylglycerophosphatase A
MISTIRIWVVTMFGIGFSGLLVNIVASLTTCFLFYFFFKYWVMNLHSGWHIPYDLLFLFFYLFSVLFSINCINGLSPSFKKKHFNKIVIGKFYGQSLPFLLFYISYFFTINLSNIFLFSYDQFLFCFLLFVFFDVIKPVPIKLFRKNLKDGLDILVRDLLSGFFTFTSYTIISYLVMVAY